jgi:hypothetical protein
MHKGQLNKVASNPLLPFFLDAGITAEQTILPSLITNCHLISDRNYVMPDLQ